MKSLFTLVCGVIISWSSSAQTELKENVRYEGLTSLVIPTLGITFTIPEGWYGGIASGSSFMVLADDTNEVTIIITADEMVEELVAPELQQTIALDETISISPKGTIQKEGKRWWGDYTINGVAREMQGYLEVRLGEFTIGAGCIVMALPSSFDRGKKAAAAILKSMIFTAPVQSQASASSGIDMPWNDYLKGKSLKYYYTQGDFSDTDFIHLCSDGSFTRRKNTVSGGITGTGTLYDKNMGTWQATGQGNVGSLILTFRDGATEQFQLQYGEGKKGRGLYLNGYRYFVEASTQCN